MIGKTSGKKNKEEKWENYSICSVLLTFKCWQDRVPWSAA